MKISANTALFPWMGQNAIAPKQTVLQPLAKDLLQETDAAVKLTLSKEGLESYHGKLTGGKQPEELEEFEELKKKGISMEEIPAYCHSLNFGIGLGGSLQHIGRKYAEKYDEIVQNHGKGNRVIIRDEDTGKIRDATLEEKLAVLDESFEYALEFAKMCEDRRPLLIKGLEDKVSSYRQIGAVDLADEAVCRLEKLKSIPKLPDNYLESMKAIREKFKATYAMSSNNEAWADMLEAINQLFIEK